MTGEAASRAHLGLPGNQQQLLEARGASVALPVRELKGFRRITLAPGESKRVDFTIGRNELAFWNLDMQDLVEPASATVWIGPNSAEGQSVDFVIAK